MTPDAPLSLETGRFERFARIDWWDQKRLREARVLVVGAGAIGNETVKNLSLLGVGNLAVADMDHVEESNLTRSVLFRPEDQGRLKAEVVCDAAKRLYPDISATSLIGNVVGDVGLGWFRWADIVIGALDNREARVYVNSTCAMLGKPWIDGGIDVLNGIVRGFAPPATACYECTMNQTDWDLLNKRRSCSLLARRAFDAGGAPTTPTTASIVGAMQAQEVVKYLHGMDIFAGAGFVFEGRTHSSYQVSYPIKPDCPWHETPPAVEAVNSLGQQSTLKAVWDAGCERLGELDAIDLAHEIVTTLSCSSCGTTTDVFAPTHKINEQQAVCPDCGTERRPDFAASIAANSPWLEKTVGEFGLPAWDVVWVRRGMKSLGIELGGDASDES
jgi:molybdopterin/thiamine biosynthesis adenylyltransferase